ncbi:MAG: phytanoyl-CoA dioxygenase family protein [Pirellulales bacterium]
MAAIRALKDSIAENGFLLARHVVDAARRDLVLESLGPLTGAGRRGVLGMLSVAELASSTTLLDLVRPYVPGEPFAVRAIYFSKSADANWYVSWHQDLTIAVGERRKVVGFEAWSVKEGVPHVQPPDTLLERMLTVRLHLDDTDSANGALRVLPGSHRFGRLSAEAIERQRTNVEEFVCDAMAGDVLLIRPLLLHASARSTTDRERRVLHIEFAGELLPGGLEWHNRF